MKVRKKYPILMKIIDAAADAEGNVEEHFRQDFIKRKTDPYCSKQKAQTTILYFTTHPTQNLERIIVCAKKIVYKPPEFNYHFALLRSLLVAVLRHIREVHESAPNVWQ